MPISAALLQNSACAQFAAADTNDAESRHVLYVVGFANIKQQHPKGLSADSGLIADAYAGLLSFRGIIPTGECCMKTLKSSLLLSKKHTSKSMDTLPAAAWCDAVCWVVGPNLHPVTFIGVCTLRKRPWMLRNTS
jgi:hypothetical protein